MRKKKNRGEGGNQNRICMHKILHICSHGNHSACHSLVKLHQGRWGPLSAPWWAWLPETDSLPPPTPTPQPTSRSFTTLLFLFNSHLARFFIANHTTNDHQGLKKEKEGSNAVHDWSMALMILMNRWGGVGLRRNSGPQLSDEHLKDFPARVYRLGGQRSFSIPDQLSRSV